MTRLISVTGATGALGGRVARLLAAEAADHDATLRLVSATPGAPPACPVPRWWPSPGATPTRRA